VSGNNSLPVEERELTMELAILVDTESNKAPTIGKDGVVNEAQGESSHFIDMLSPYTYWLLNFDH
jgi:hypothetical protein